MNALHRIAIIGAGPAGLTAARILQVRGLRVRVFEGDDSNDARDQGGSLDLSTEGLKAIEIAGLMDEFRAYARYEDQDTRYLDHASAAPLYERRGPSNAADRPEIDRKALCELLLKSLSPGTVCWGHKLRSLTPDGVRHHLEFENGDSETYDFVIGADGTWSTVRAALSEVVPGYSGVTVIESWIDSIDDRYADLAELVGHGTMFSFHANHGVIAQRNDKSRVRVYAAFRRPVTWTTELGVDVSSPRDIRSALLAMFADWSPRLLAFIDRCPDRFAIRPIHALPVDFRWQCRPAITLVGDAAHVMPPVGVGVNLAMLDAAELGVALSDSNWSAAVAKYELDMLARAHSIAPTAHRVFGDMFSDDAPASILQRIQGARG